METERIKIVFVCHGNICRSPMAQYIFLHLCREAGIEDRFIVNSLAVSNEEYGNDIYPNAKYVLREHGIPFDHHYARPISQNALDFYDKVICADRANLRAMERRFAHIDMDERVFQWPEPDAQFSLMMQWAGEERDVSDPWYTRDFEKAYQDIYAACQGIVRWYQNK